MNLHGSNSSGSWFASCLVALGVAAAAWAGTEWGLFALFDGAIYDELMRLRSRTEKELAEFALVWTDSDDPGPSAETLATLVRELSKLDPKVIVTDVPLPSDSDAFFEAAQAAGNVVIGRHLPEVLGPADDGLLDDAMTGTWEDRVPWGIAAAPLGTSGVYRRHGTYAWVPRREDPSPHLAQDNTEDVRWVRVDSVELAAAARILGRRPAIGAATYLVDFRGAGPESTIENYRLEGVLGGNMQDGALRGHCVLVGSLPTPGAPRLMTPVGDHGHGVSLLGFRALAIRTLLEDAPLQPLRPEALAIVLALAALIGRIAYRRLSLQSATWLTMVLLATYTSVSGLLLVRNSTWMPPTGLCVVQLTLLFLALRRGVRSLQGAMQQFVSDASSQLKDRYWPLLTYSKDPHWRLVANMINQTLDLNRLIFLEANDESHQVKEILSLHCSIGDVAERRRDYTRSPYADALSKRAPIRVRNYLKTMQRDEEQYLTALMFGDELLGFWAFGIDENKAASIPQFDTVLQDYTQKISELLYCTKKMFEQETLSRTVRRRLTTEKTDLLQQDLASALRLLNTRLGTLETLLNTLESGVIIYDMFGRVLQINARMLDMLSKEDLKPFEMTALDFILAVSDHDLSVSRKLLRRVIVEDGTVSFPASLQSVGGRRLRVYLKPLSDGDDNEVGPAGKRFYGKYILCEIVDTRSLALLFEMKQHLSERVGVQLRHDLAAIDLCSEVLRGRLVTPDQRSHIAGLIGDRVERDVDLLTEVQRYVRLDTEEDELERVPVDPLAAWRAAAEASSGAVKSRKVNLRCEEPAVASFVFGSMTRLPDVLTTILVLLCEDCMEGGSIVVKVREADDKISFEFANTGFGLPNDLFQDYLAGTQAAAGEAFMKLREMGRWVRGWGGNLVGSSNVGEGTRFRLELTKFI